MLPVLTKELRIREGALLDRVVIEGVTRAFNFNGRFSPRVFIRPTTTPTGEAVVPGTVLTMTTPIRTVMETHEEEGFATIVKQEIEARKCTEAFFVTESPIGGVPIVIVSWERSSHATIILTAEIKHAADGRRQIEDFTVLNEVPALNSPLFHLLQPAGNIAQA